MADGNPLPNSAIDTDTPGRVPKASVITALQASGEASYDRARETLKSVSVDASGKVELEDWVEVRDMIEKYTSTISSHYARFSST